MAAFYGAPPTYFDWWAGVDVDAELELYAAILSEGDAPLTMDGLLAAMEGAGLLKRK